MPQFLGDIAFLLELGLVASGRVLLHAGRVRSAVRVRAAIHETHEEHATIVDPRRITLLA